MRTLFDTNWFIYNNTQIEAKEIQPIDIYSLDNSITQSFQVEDNTFIVGNKDNNIWMVEESNFDIYKPQILTALQNNKYVVLYNEDDATISLTDHDIYNSLGFKLNSWSKGGTDPDGVTLYLDENNELQIFALFSPEMDVNLNTKFSIIITSVYDLLNKNSHE